MALQSGHSSSRKQRRRTLGVFYIFVLVPIVLFSIAARRNEGAEKELMALEIVVSVGAIWSFIRFLRTADAHQKLINHQAMNFAFVASLLLTLIVGLLQRFGIFPRASLLIPALMIAFWSIGLILFSWRYQ